MLNISVYLDLCASFLNVLQNSFTMETNILNSDHSALLGELQSDLGLLVLLHKFKYTPQYFNHGSKHYDS